MSGGASGRIPKSFIDDLIIRVDIVDLIDSYLPLKKSGSNYVARCPFHNEKTPSFSVSRQKQFYHCFGCGAGGNAISFLMEFSHLGFVEAVEDLAGFAGVDVPRESAKGMGGRPQKSTKSLDDVFAVLSTVSSFYQQQLKDSEQGREAIKYLKLRGVSGEMARDYVIGFAPDQWDALIKQFDRAALRSAGMLSSNDSGREYDRFRGRLMFPIRDRRGRVIGFGGRVMGEGQPKYLNSPETDVFVKGREVYGLFELLKQNGKPQRIIIVEGYMDVISLAQFGIKNVVATLGTATTKDHLSLLFRFTNELVFCFDGDNAGRQAAWRAIEVALSSLGGRRLVKVFTLPQEHDPDTLVRQVGADEFNRQVEGAESLSGYFFRRVTEQLNIESIESKVRVVDEAEQFLRVMPNGLAKEMMQKQLFEKTQLVGVGADDASHVGNKRQLKRTPLRVVMALLVQNPELINEVAAHEVNWNECSFSGKELLLKLLAKIESEAPENAAMLLEKYRGTEDEMLISKLAVFEVSPFENEGFNEEAEFNGALQRVVSQGKQLFFNELIEKKLSKK